jgi:hypothetical protein
VILDEGFLVTTTGATVGFLITTGVLISAGVWTIIRLHHVLVGFGIVVVFSTGITRDSRAKSPPELSVDEKTSASSVSILPVTIVEPVVTVHDATIAPEDTTGAETSSPESNHKRTGIFLMFTKS